MTLAADAHPDAFSAAHAVVAGRASGDLAHARERGLARFVTLGLPSVRDEEWRWTPVTQLARIPFEAAPAAGEPGAASLARHAIASAGPRVVLVNGRAASAHAVPPAAADARAGVRVEGLATALAERRREASSALFRLVGAATEGAFPSLNAALLEDGAFVHVPAAHDVTAPIQVLALVAASEGPIVSSPRLVIVLEENARATVIETHAGAENDSLSNAVVEIELAAGASLEHIHVQAHGEQAHHVATTRVRVARDATYRSHVVSLGARLSRHDLSVELAGEGARCELFGLSLLGGSQHADHHTFVDHAVPHGSSEQVYEGAYAGTSRGVFSGAVLVRRHAQRTEAHQKNRNLILSDGALVDSKPQLEILADDVRCTHGATIGQIEDDTLFYLRARGIGEQDAREMLVRGFLQEQVSRIACEPARADIERRVSARLLDLELARS